MSSPRERRTVASTPARETSAKVSLGTMPDYTVGLETGVRVADVRAGSSADLAGIKAGDILMTWNGQEISGARKLGEFLGKHEPGDKVKIILQRGYWDRLTFLRQRGLPVD